MFASTKRFRAAVELINGVEPKPFSKILGRVLSSLPDKVRCLPGFAWAESAPRSLTRSITAPSRSLSRARTQGASVFSEVEMTQMRELFGLESAQLDVLLGGCNFIFEQAAYATTPPDQLNVELIGAGVSEDHARAFAAAWQAGATDVVRRLKENAVLAPRHLTGVDWQLCVGARKRPSARAPSAPARIVASARHASPPSGWRHFAGPLSRRHPSRARAAQERRAAAASVASRRTPSWSSR